MFINIKPVVLTFFLKLYYQSLFKKKFLWESQNIRFQVCNLLRESQQNNIVVFIYTSEVK